MARAIVRAATEATGLPNLPAARDLKKQSRDPRNPGPRRPQDLDEEHVQPRRQDGGRDRRRFRHRPGGRASVRRSKAVTSGASTCTPTPRRRRRRLIAKAGGRADAGAIDITDMTSVNDAIVEGRVNAQPSRRLVCTPAINVRKPILKYTGDEFDRVVQVNLRGNFNVLQSAGLADGAARLRQHRAVLVDPLDRHRARAVGVFDDQGRHPAAGEDRGHRMGHQGVRVNAVGPGVIETPLTAPIKAERRVVQRLREKNPMNRWAQASEMAGPTVFLLSDAASYVTGTILYADGGWLAADGRFTPPGM